jgi:hypothetical protein
VVGVRLKRNAYRVLVGKPKEKRLEDLGVDGRLICFVPQIVVSIGLLNNWKGKIMNLKELG